ncbi:MAG: histidine phosphatase family protein [Caldilineaceae bacterium]|nr:histidine phosphatase family protein [Caldilineaceae bacterium]
MTTFYLIRHGENDRIAGDQSLNANGRRQAQITAAFLKDRRIDAVYASPLARARETAQAIADALGSTVIEDARLRERANFGDSPGQTLEEFISMWQDCDRDRDFVPVVGLSARQNGQRLEAWMREVYHTRPQGIVVAGTHGGTITDFLLNYFSPAFLNGYRSNFLHNIRNCSITILHFDGAQFTLEALAVDEHLLPIAPM